MNTSYYTPLTSVLSRLINESPEEYMTIDPLFPTPINYNNMTFHRYQSNKTQDKFSSNATYTNLGDCEIHLKQINNIDTSESLILHVFDLPTHNTERLTYRIFSPDSSIELYQSDCKSIDIDISVLFPVNSSNQDKYDEAKNLSDNNINVHDPKDKFFTDVCYPSPQ